MRQALLSILRVRSCSDAGTTQGSLPGKGHMRSTHPPAVLCSHPAGLGTPAGWRAWHLGTVLLCWLLSVRSVRLGRHVELVIPRDVMLSCKGGSPLMAVPQLGEGG